MNNSDSKEIIAMLAVIYKQLDDISRKVENRGWKTAPIQTYLDELREKASKIFVR
jgi:hypothetical protein